MAYIRTTLTDELTGKNTEFCFNSEFVASLQPAREATIITFSDGRQVIVDTAYQTLLRYLGAKDRLE